MSTTRLSTQTKNTQASSGFTLVELIVVVSVVAVLATAALDKLFWYQGQAEKANMEYTASMIKSGLWMSAASLMMTNRGSEIPALTKQNPINLLAQKPENYLGELNGNNTASLKGGNWFYDTSKHEVGYIVNQRRDFTPAITDDYTVRYGMKVLYSELELASGKKAPYISGVTLVPLTKYVWQ